MKKSVDELLNFVNFAKHDNEAARKIREILHNSTEDEFYEFVGLVGQQWPDEHIASGHSKPRLKPGKWFVDVDGLTEATCKDQQGAKMAAKDLRKSNPHSRIEIRFWKETEEEAACVYNEKRKQHWENIIYRR